MPSRLIEPTEGAPALYIGEMGVAAALRMCLMRPRGHVWYFDASPAGEQVARRLARLRAFPEARRLAFTVADVVEPDGSRCYPRVWEDMRRMCVSLDEEVFSRHPTVRVLSFFYEEHSLRFALRKYAAESIRDRVACIRAALWNERERHAAAPAVYFLRSDLFARVLAPYAAEEGFVVRRIPYVGVRGVLRRGRKRVQVLSERGNGVDDASVNVPSEEPCRADAPPASIGPGPWVARIHLGEQTLNLEPGSRSGFFWFVEGGLPPGRVLAYTRENAYGTRHPFTARMARDTRDAGLAFLSVAGDASQPGVAPVWRPGVAYRRGRAAGGLRIVLAAVAGLISLRPPPFSMVALFTYYAERYAWWYDLFESTGIKVHVDNEDFAKSTVPEHAALRAAGGVSVSYQWSDLPFADIEVGTAADVYFTFGPAYEQIWADQRCDAQRIVQCGYITDHSFGPAREAAKELRERLQRAGAEYVVAYFDENTGDERLNPAKNATNEMMHRSWAEAVLADPTLAVVLKPKRPGTLFERLGDAGPVLREGMSTGRLVVLGEGTWSTDVFPVQAGLASDLAVGHLLARTAVFECALAGVPSVFVDTEGLTSLPEYSQDMLGSTLFPDLDSLLGAIRAHRADPGSVSGFGDLSRWLEGRDPFMDGRASARMGEYIRALLGVFERGGTREAAIEAADRAYSEAWGGQYVEGLR